MLLKLLRPKTKVVETITKKCILNLFINIYVNMITNRGNYWQQPKDPETEKKTKRDRQTDKQPDGLNGQIV